MPPPNTAFSECSECRQYDPAVRCPLISFPVPRFEVAWIEQGPDFFDRGNVREHDCGEGLVISEQPGVIPARLVV